MYQYCRDKLALKDNGAIVDFDDNTTDMFKFKEKIGQSGGNSTKDAEIMVPLKCFSNFWRTFEALLINCEINLMLTWSANCVISSNAAANQGTTFDINDTKLDLLVVTLWTKDNKKLRILEYDGIDMSEGIDVNKTN